MPMHFIARFEEPARKRERVSGILEKWRQSNAAWLHRFAGNAVRRRGCVTLIGLLRMRQ